jgi:urease accessory protein
LPIVFPSVMALGGVLGVLGLPVPMVEIGVSSSAIVLGALVATDTRPALGLAAGLVAAFAIFHGYAHGAELPSAVNPLAYGVGFVTSTGLLHLAGILLGTLYRWPAGIRVVRGTGALIACVGGFFLYQSLIGQTS